MGTNLSTLIVGFIIGTSSSLLASFIWQWPIRWSKDPWSHPYRRKLRPGSRGAKDLNRLIKLLGGIHFWLDSNDTRLIREIQSNLWKVITDLQIEELLYLAVYSEDIDKQLWAVRKLSQIKKDKGIEMLSGIIGNPATSSTVRSVATMWLNEINQYSKPLVNESNSSDKEKRIDRPIVFVSCSRKDEKEKDKLLSQLGVLERANLIDLWSDERIGVGADWKSEISQVISVARVAVLLISANFLTSNFILKKEIPKLLERRDKGELTIFPVIARPCAWKTHDWLSNMNVRPKNGDPVWRDGGIYVDKELAFIAQEIMAIVGGEH